MKRGKWRDQARAMHSADPGLSYAEIGRRFGVTRSAVSKLLNPDRAKIYNQRSEASPGRREAKTAWDRANYGKRFDWCECGLAKLKISERCVDCLHATATVRRTLAEGMWADGWSLREMAAAMGVKAGYFSVMRIERGWDLPYRYQGTKRQRPAVNEIPPFYQFLEAA